MTEHPSGAPRAVASSPSPRRAAVDEIERLPRPTVAFYCDLVGLPVIESFAGSYGEDGTIFGPLQRHRPDRGFLRRAEDPPVLAARQPAPQPRHPHGRSHPDPAYPQ